MEIGIIQKERERSDLPPSYYMKGKLPPQWLTDWLYGSCLFINFFEMKRMDLLLLLARPACRRKSAWSSSEKSPIVRTLSLSFLLLYYCRKIEFEFLAENKKCFLSKKGPSLNNEQQQESCWHCVPKLFFCCCCCCFPLSLFLSLLFSFSIFLSPWTFLCKTQISMGRRKKEGKKERKKKRPRPPSPLKRPTTNLRNLRP